jgi:hypothetical protein
MFGISIPFRRILREIAPLANISPDAVDVAAKVAKVGDKAIRAIW